MIGCFDHSPAIGDALDVGYEPYVRQHRGTLGGLYGTAGPVTEQFALGSAFWYMTRNSELYSELEGPDQVDRLLEGKFPATVPHDPIDKIIANCWNGFYPQIADLVMEIRALPGLEMQGQKPMPAGQKHDKTQLLWRCQVLSRVEDREIEISELVTNGTGQVMVYSGAKGQA